MNFSGNGGFMQDGPGGSQSPGGGKSRDKNTIRPVTIRQLLDAEQPHPDADFTIDNAEISQISFIAKVLNITKGATNISYTVEDGTGSIDVRSWIESQDDDTGVGEGISQDVLIRVMGTIKLFSGKRFINALHVHPVQDMNEQQFHILEVIHVHLLNTRGPPAGQSNGAPRIQSTNSGPSDYAQASTSHQQTDAYSDLTNPIQRKIMSYIARLGPSDALPAEGVYSGAIARSIGISEDQIRDGIESLVQEGHLYSTSDDDHVLPTAT